MDDNNNRSSSRLVDKIVLGDPFGSKDDIFDLSNTATDSNNQDLAESINDQSNQGGLETEDLVEKPTPSVDGDLSALASDEPELGISGEEEQEAPVESLIDTPEAEMAKILKSTGLFGEDYEIQGDLDAKGLVQAVLDRSEKLAEDKAAEQNKFLLGELDRLTNAKAEEMGYSEDQKRLADLAIMGYSQEMISGVGQLKALTRMVLEDDNNDDPNITDETLEKNQEIIADAYLRFTAKQLDEETRNKIIDSYKKDGLLGEKSKSHQSFFKEQSKKIDNDVQQAKRDNLLQNEAQDKARRKSVRDVITGNKELRGYPINMTAEDMERKIFDPTETITVKDMNGQDRERKVSLYTKKMMNLESNPSDAALLAALVLNDFNFGEVMSKGEQKATQDFDDTLNNLKESFVKKKATPVRNLKASRFDKFVTNR